MAKLTSIAIVAAFGISGFGLLSSSQADPGATRSMYSCDGLARADKKQLAVVRFEATCTVGAINGITGETEAQVMVQRIRGDRFGRIAKFDTTPAIVSEDPAAHGSCRREFSGLLCTISSTTPATLSGQFSTAKANRCDYAVVLSHPDLRPPKKKKYPPRKFATGLPRGC